MRLVIQRVDSCEVENFVKKEIVGKIGKGLFILVGISNEDTEEKAKILARKVYKMRIIADKEGKMNLSIKDTSSEVMVVSQFTLYADTSGGNRPSFIKAARPEVAKKVYQAFIEELVSLGVNVETGSFGDYMKIKAILDGPVTILV